MFYCVLLCFYCLLLCLVFFQLASFSLIDPHLSCFVVFYFAAFLYSLVGGAARGAERRSHCALQTHQSQVSKKHLFWPTGRAEGCVCTERHPGTPRYFLALSISNTPLPGIQKHFCWPMVCRGGRVWGASFVHGNTPIQLNSIQFNWIQSNSILPNSIPAARSSPKT